MPYLRLKTSVAAGAMSAMLSGCVASYIDLEAERVEDEIRFRNPNAGLFSSDCVRVVEVTNVETREVVWADGSRTSGCLFETPFAYGQKSDLSDPKDYKAAKPLEPGNSYEIFVELDGGAGDGSFTIAADGRVTNSG